MSKKLLKVKFYYREGEYNLQKGFILFLTPVIPKSKEIIEQAIGEYYKEQYSRDIFQVEVEYFKELPYIDY